MSARTNNDASLITLCAKFDQLERKFQASFAHSRPKLEYALEAEAEAARAAARQD